MYNFSIDQKKMIQNVSKCYKKKRKSNTKEQFWSHEWNKHGSCSGLSRKDYFMTSLKLKDKYEGLCSGKIKVNGLKLFKKYNKKLGGEECGICFNKLLTHVVDCS